MRCAHTLGQDGGPSYSPLQRQERCATAAAAPPKRGRARLPPPSRQLSGAARVAKAAETRRAGRWASSAARRPSTLRPSRADAGMAHSRDMGACARGRSSEASGLVLGTLSQNGGGRSEGGLLRRILCKWARKPQTSGPGFPRESAPSACRDGSGHGNPAPSPSIQNFRRCSDAQSSESRGHVEIPHERARSSSRLHATSLARCAPQGSALDARTRMFLPPGPICGIDPQV